MEPGTVLKIHSDDHWQEVFENCVQEQKILVTDFGATWCGPCRRIYPHYAKLCELSATDEETRSLFVFTKVDIDECNKTAALNGVQAVPTFTVHYRGQLMRSTRGASEEGLRAMIEECHLDWRNIQDTEVTPADAAYEASNLVAVDAHAPVHVQSD